MGTIRGHPKRYLTDMDLEIPLTRGGNFKPSIIPERKRKEIFINLKDRGLSGVKMIISV